ncbi:MAG: hypothetical protein ACREGK_14935 [Geminicoccales bacterium]
MVPTLVRLGVLAGVATIALAPAAPAQTFQCTAQTAGQLSIQGIVQCECRLFLESRLAGTPTGWRWHCGILQARMNQDVPATANPYPYPLPPALLLDGARLRHHRVPD